MAILLNDNLDIAANKPVDNRYGPYSTVAAAIAAIPSFKRHIGLTVGIGLTNTVDYWFKAGTGDTDLIEKVPTVNVPVTSVAGKTGAVTLVKGDVGLGNVDNTSDANKPVSTATQTALNAKENTITAGTTSQYWRGDKTWQTLDKSSVGLGNVDNTSDANKPVSTATQTALDAKQATLVSGTTIKTINGNSLLGAGDIAITGGGGSGNTNLSYTASTTGGTVLSDTGSDATLTLADTTNAGLMSPADKTKLNSVATNANNYAHPNHTGDVTSTGDGVTVIANNAVTNAKLTQIAANVIKGRATTGTGNVEDLTAAQVRTILNVADGAQVNVNADWNATSGDAQILNKPNVYPYHIRVQIDSTSYLLFYTGLLQAGRPQYQRRHNAANAFATLEWSSSVSTWNFIVDGLSLARSASTAVNPIDISSSSWVSPSTFQPVPVFIEPYFQSPQGGNSSLVCLSNDGTWTTLGGAALRNVGTGAGTVAAGDDSRLFDARTPLSHTHVAVNDLRSTAPLQSVIVSGAEPAFVASLLNGTYVLDGTDSNTSRPLYRGIENVYAVIRWNGSAWVIEDSGDNYYEATGDQPQPYQATWPMSVSVTAGPSGLLLPVPEGRILVADGGGNVSWPLIDTALAYLGAAPISHTHTASDISDSTAAGRALLTAATVQSQRTALDIFVSAANLAAIQALTGNFQRVYLALDTGKLYIWSGTGSTYIEVSPNIKSDWNATSGDAQILNKPLTVPYHIIAACSDETSLLTTGQKLVFQNFVMKSVSAFRASVTEAPAGSAIVIQLRTGTNVLATVTINAGSKQASVIDGDTVPSSLGALNEFLADNTLPVELNVNIQQVGGTSAGRGLKVYLEGTRPL